MALAGDAGDFEGKMILAEIVDANHQPPLVAGAEGGSQIQRTLADVAVALLQVVVSDFA